MNNVTKNVVKPSAIKNAMILVLHVSIKNSFIVNICLQNTIAINFNKNKFVKSIVKNLLRNVNIIALDFVEINAYKFVENVIHKMKYFKNILAMKINKMLYLFSQNVDIYLNNKDYMNI